MDKIVVITVQIMDIDEAIKKFPLGGNFRPVENLNDVAHQIPLIASCAEIPHDVKIGMVFVPMKRTMEDVLRHSEEHMRKAVLSGGSVKLGA